ncbi:MAG: hypothetical protein C0502_01315 [Opitutus sp.]|nr:hypothetical protein [Opitutus sp.]
MGRREAGRAPWLQAGLQAIGAIFALRGLAVIWEAISLWRHRPAGPCGTRSSRPSRSSPVCATWLRRTPD